ncbi:MAG: chloride channel protein [Rhodobacteraceae bacterium]|jgi:CIC family chloride channel protein|nr:chloride channel protein [Paracoccaceae bacterium]
MMVDVPDHTASAERVTPSTLMQRIITVLSVGLVIGAVTAVAAIAFVEAVLWLNDLLLVSSYAKVQSGLSPMALLLLTLMVPMVGGALVSFIVFRLAPIQRPAGPADAIHAVQLQKPMPDTGSGIIVTLGALGSLGVGASVGQYGPMVFLGAVIGGMVEKLRLDVPNVNAIAIACGVAASISAAFNAPIAGLIFAHEAILRHYSMQAFAPVTIASTVGFVVANVLFERVPVFVVQTGVSLKAPEFVVFAFMGLLCGAVSIIYMRSLLAGARIGRLIKLPPEARGAVAGLLVGLCALWLPEITGLGQYTLRFATIEGALTASEMTMILVGKIMLTSICLGLGFVGGVFSPALIVGAMLGGLVWTGLTTLGIEGLAAFPVYVICAMMAVTSPVIGAPLTAILIVFELTRSYELSIASMVVVVFSNVVAFRFFGRSLFDMQLLLRGYDLSQGRAEAQLSELPVRDYAADHAPIFEVGSGQAVVRAELDDHGWNEGYAVDAEGFFQGYLRIIDLDADSHEPVAEIIRPAQLVFDADTSVRDAMRMLEDFVGDAIPIVERDSQRLVGVVTEAAIVRAYLDIVAKLRSEENAGL